MTSCFFFFQAEDGIRDIGVTGVQTCALPICRETGVPVEVVPGVSSALAAPLSAGIPLTHRGTTGAFHVVNGHDGLDAAARLVVREASATLVVLMGVSVLADMVAELVAAGADPATPVAIVENGATPRQRVTRAPLDAIAERAREVGARAPAVAAVGHATDPALPVPTPA